MHPVRCLALDRAARREAREEAGVRISADQQEFWGAREKPSPGCQSAAGGVR